MLTFDYLKKWFRASGVRALKTICQTALSMIPVGVMIQEVSWVAILSTSLLSGFISILTSVVGLPEIKLEEENEELLKEDYGR